MQPVSAGDDRERDRDTADCKRRCDDQNRPSVDSDKVAEAYRRMIRESQERERQRQEKEKKKGGGK